MNCEGFNFIICDDQCRVMTLSGVRMWGKTVSLPAIFMAEQDALDVLFAIESSVPDMPPHRVMRVAPNFTATVCTYDGNTERNA